MKQDLRSVLRTKRLYFDGGTGTVLQEMGLRSGQAPETLNVEAPETIVALHRAYLVAGCDIIKTNTFGIHRLKYDNYRELIEAGLACAREAARQRVHTLDEVGRRARYVFSYGHTGIITRSHGHTIEELVERDDVAGLEEHGRAARFGGVAADLYLLVVSGLACADSLHGHVHGKYFGQGSGWDSSVGILLVKDVAGSHIHEYGALGVDRASYGRNGKEQAEEEG